MVLDASPPASRAAAWPRLRHRRGRHRGPVGARLVRGRGPGNAASARRAAPSGSRGSTPPTPRPAAARAPMARYELRYGTVPIGASNFSLAIPSPRPRRAPGSANSHADATGLRLGRPYHFDARARPRRPRGPGGRHLHPALDRPRARPSATRPSPSAATSPAASTSTATRSPTWWSRRARPPRVGRRRADLLGSATGLSSTRCTGSAATRCNRFGATVASLGDVNGDGLGDVAVAEPGPPRRHLPRPRRRLRLLRPPHLEPATTPTSPPAPTSPSAAAAPAGSPPPRSASRSRAGDFNNGLNGIAASAPGPPPAARCSSCSAFRPRALHGGRDHPQQHDHGHALRPAPSSASGAWSATPRRPHSRSAGAHLPQPPPPVRGRARQRPSLTLRRRIHPRRARDDGQQPQPVRRRLVTSTADGRADFAVGTTGRSPGSVALYFGSPRRPGLTRAPPSTRRSPPPPGPTCSARVATIPSGGLHPSLSSPPHRRRPPHRLQRLQQERPRLPSSRAARGWTGLNANLAGAAGALHRRRDATAQRDDVGRRRRRRRLPDAAIARSAGAKEPSSSCADRAPSLTLPASGPSLVGDGPCRVGARASPHARRPISAQRRRVAEQRRELVREARRGESRWAIHRARPSRSSPRRSCADGRRPQSGGGRTPPAARSPQLGHRHRARAHTSSDARSIADATSSMKATTLASTPRFSYSPPPRRASPGPSGGSPSPARPGRRSATASGTTSLIALAPGSRRRRELRRLALRRVGGHALEEGAAHRPVTIATPFGNAPIASSCVRKALHHPREDPVGEARHRVGLEHRGRDPHRRRERHHRPPA